MNIDGKVVLLTGGTGSFGKKFTRTLLETQKPKAVRIFSRGEYLQYQMRQEFDDDPRLRFFIGDVRDRERVYRAMNGVDIVVHAAALKQVPTCEYNPIEAVKTNIDGSANVIDAAIDNGVERVMAISTDKAVQPVNLYGATKLVAEKLFVQANAYTGSRKTKFSVVRYGNVVGSRGSVVPLFLTQREKGRITLTDERMTRFWITLEQGVCFVIDCIGRMQGGEIFVPKIPSMRLVDLADVLAPGICKETIGIRPGEKLHECLITAEEARHAREYDGFYVIEPEHSFWKKDDDDGGTPLPDGFCYTSDSNGWWLTGEELKNMVESLDDYAKQGKVD
ncbi:UDP-N-acetylglucosamine 4,6-dehydratase (inverting) [Acetomicrobium hydrogeniformans]|jgi:UDP-N-acetylglucosamine 4,6-dehydratase (inverting)|uniref:UDP-N-acetylglucosamine 4,6-dehydratase n=1 Tax=Acetomicrobium hydrogeniformans ATCC BAA-1850 TaxID=592015 RepID=A0A0T5XBZ2_9BACT|nr:UDP-N-acetylglucosamine 4,6-dehydratase (inverting) [Acetomicrobium hydrogeniformans]KRT35868.1 UDP-N-acetylglucosamine 4,6-dehydratase [Acetomicrobium hydrogeniformans ATCC BAA-1850]